MFRGDKVEYALSIVHVEENVVDEIAVFPLDVVGTANNETCEWKRRRNDSLQNTIH